MEKHPIENIMTTTMDSIRDMVDVNTVIGEPIATQDGSTVIPVSKVSFGFVSGGGEYSVGARQRDNDGERRLPFGGGAGAGVTIQPVGFLVAAEDSVRLLPTQPYAPADRVIELLPQLLGEVKTLLQNKNQRQQIIAQSASPE